MISPSITADPNYESFVGFVTLANGTKPVVESSAARQLKNAIDMHLEALTAESRGKLIAYIKSVGMTIDKQAKLQRKAVSK